MKAWNFKVENNPNDISKKLESALGSVKGFVFNIDQSRESSSKLR